jgi:hypothetical protein
MAATSDVRTCRPTIVAALDRHDQQAEDGARRRDDRDLTRAGQL